MDTHLPGYTGQHTYWVMCNKAARRQSRMLTLACFLRTRGKRLQHRFYFCEANQCLAKGLCSVMTRHNHNRFEFKVKAMKREFRIGSSDLSINFLLRTLRTTCIYMAILICHKSSQPPGDPLLSVIYVSPTGILDSSRLTRCF